MFITLALNFSPFEYLMIFLLKEYDFLNIFISLCIKGFFFLKANNNKKFE